MITTHLLFFFGGFSPAHAAEQTTLIDQWTAPVAVESSTGRQEAYAREARIEVAASHTLAGPPP